MKNKIYVFIITLLIVHFSLNLLWQKNCMCQWVQMSNGMGNNNAIYSFAKIGNNIFAGTLNNGVFVSSNNGASWSQTALSSITINTLAIKDNILFAGAYGGIYLSTNNGASWVMDTLDIDYGDVTSIVVSGNNIFAGTSGPVPNSIYGVYISSDNGGSWIHTNIDYKIISLGVYGNNVFAGKFHDGMNYGVFLSTNNGTNWTQNYLGTIAHCFAISGNNIFLGTGGILHGIYFSTNNGSNWIQSGLNNKYIVSLAISGNNLFAGTIDSDSGFFVSTNTGQNWIRRNEGFGFNQYIKSIIILNNYIFAGTVGNSVWRRPLSELITGINTTKSETPSSFSLFQNYPNPFNPSTNIKYQITNNKFITLKVYDMLGKEVETLVNEKQSPGTYEVSFDASNLTSGIYFYSIYADGMRINTKRMILLK